MPHVRSRLNGMKLSVLLALLIVLVSCSPSSAPHHCSCTFTVYCDADPLNGDGGAFRLSGALAGRRGTLILSALRISKDASNIRRAFSWLSNANLILTPVIVSIAIAMCLTGRLSRRANSVRPSLANSIAVVALFLLSTSFRKNFPYLSITPC